MVYIQPQFTLQNARSNINIATNIPDPLQRSTGGGITLVTTDL
jgi:hypothetical protein